MPLIFVGAVSVEATQFYFLVAGDKLLPIFYRFLINLSSERCHLASLFEDPFIVLELFYCDVITSGHMPFTLLMGLILFIFKFI